MNAKDLRARLEKLAKRLDKSMDDPDVCHHLRRLEPGIEQLEEVVNGIESKVASVEQSRGGTRKKSSTH